MRKWIFWLLLAGFAWLVISNLAEIKTLAITLASGQALWILAAGGMMVPYYFVYAVSYQMAYDAVGIKRSLRELLPVIFGMLFVNLVTPTGGSAGVALFVDEAMRRGYSGARAMSGTILQMLVDFGSLSIGVILSLYYLYLWDSLSAYHVAGAGIQIGLTVVLSVSLMMGLWAPALLLRLLHDIQRLGNRLARLIRQPHFFADNWAEGYAEELTEASRSIASHPAHLAGAFLAMIVADLMAITALYFLFLAFHAPVSLEAVGVGYVVGILFWMIPITPQGVGLVEGAMTFIFVSFDVPTFTAAAITLSFRGLIFWIPMVLGFVLLGKVKTFEDIVPRPSPASAPRETTEEDRQRARGIVLAHGRTSQAHLTLIPDKTYHFTPGGSMIPYTVSGPTAVTLGDPIGPSEDAQSAIQGFLEYCRQNDWMAVFSMVEADYLEIYRRAGYVSMCLGHEGIVDLTAFTLKGNNHRTLRKRFNRFDRAGYRLVICAPPIRDDLLCELRQVSDEWLELTHGEEKRFFLASFDEEYLRGETLVVVYTPDGEISAFANLAPEYQRGGLSIDLMRHRRRFESGTMDFMFVALMFWGREHGYTSFNLGLSPLVGMDLLPHPSWVERILGLVRKYIPLNEYKGVHAFKIKFRPTWSPLFMVFPGWLNLPRAGLTVARVNAGEGENLGKYFKARSKHIQYEEPEEESLSAAARDDPTPEVEQ
jgi:uncharacterized protein (TIRG00374 family)